VRQQNIRSFLVVAIIALLAATVTTSSQQSKAGAPLPARMDAYITKYVQLTPAERAKLLGGTPVVKLLQSEPASEVAAFGAVWINGAPAEYVKLVKDIEQFERGGAFLVTKRISDPPQLADFAALKFSPGDLESLRTCKVGDCEIKLGESALQRLRKAVDWSKPDAAAAAEQIAKQLMLEYSKGYAEAGNDRLAVYRDSGRPTFVATEFKSMIDRLPELSQDLRDLKAYLLGFPKATMPNATSFLYWQEAKFGLKPTIRINHLVIDDRPGGTVIANKLIYASHYFWTALDLRVLMPDASRGPGFWLIQVMRSRSDGLAGFTGSMIRGRVQSEVQKSIDAMLQATKARMEKR
jgi:hypothetical protein